MTYALKIAGLCAALLPAAVFPAKETLHVQVARYRSSDVRDIEILDTVLIWVDYAKFPEVTSPIAGGWPAQEKDSAWVDDTSRSIRYNHNFLAETRSRKGSGSDFIHLTERAGNCLLQSDSYLDFSFPGDTTLLYQWSPAHLMDKDNAFPLHRGLKPRSEVYGEVFKYAKGSTQNLAEGQWTKLVAREDGWTGYEGNPTLALSRSVPSAPADGWAFDLRPGTQLRVPPGAHALRVFDIQGRLHWENRNLPAGAPVALPDGLPRGILRLSWRP
jgi:hypothetical protein